jgi:hypothetical protein
MPFKKKRKYSIPLSVKLYCSECQALRAVAFTDTSASFDAALLECGHSRSAYVPPQGISLEQLGSPEGWAAFPGDAKKFSITASVRADGE